MTLSSSLFTRHAVSEPSHRLSRRFRFCWVLPALMFLGAVAPLKTVAAEAEKPQTPQPLFEIRESTPRGHFDNSYEVSARTEMQEASSRKQSPGGSTATATGSTRTIAMSLPAGHTYGLGEAQWDAKKVNYGSPRPGLSGDLVITPNHVYVTQCLPGLLATGRRACSAS